MDNFKTKSISNQIQSLIDIQPAFPLQLKQRLVFKSDKVSNPFKFIGILLSKEVLCDEPTDPETNFGLKEMVVQLALMIACGKGANGIGGLMEALGESGNLQLLSDFRAWVKEDFGIEIKSDFGNLKAGDAAVATPKSEVSPRQTKNVNETSSYGTKLIDKIMSHVEGDFMQKLEGHLVGKASEIVNVPQFYSSLVHQKVLDENEIQLATAPEFQETQLFENAIKVACSKKAIGSLVIALQSSSNEGILVETYDWLETSTMRKKNYPIAVKSLANQRAKQESKAVRSSFFQQAALPDGLSKLATLKCQMKSATKGISQVQFDKKRMMACSTEGSLNLWNLTAQDEKPTNIAVNVKNTTCFQYDEEIIVLGTAQGAVHLFDARTSEEKWSVRLGGPVTSVNFVESALVIVTQEACPANVWWMDISRPDMRILNRRPVNFHYSFTTQTPGVFMNTDISFVYCDWWVSVYDTKSGGRIKDENWCESYLTAAPNFISALNVGDLISTKRVVVAGCISGTIVMWNSSKWMANQSPFKTFQGHTAAVASLCSLNGHLLSLDKSRKLLMWSGHDLEDKIVTPVARVLTENSNVTCLAVHERWFASGSSKDDIINIWTLPDLWLRTG